MIISFLNQKGGVSKTTLAVNTARALQLRGYSVALLDTDPQHSADLWHHIATDNQLTPPPFLCQRLDDPKALPRMVRDRPTPWLVIDGAPATNRNAAEAIRVSDIVVIPINPGPFDVSAGGDTVEMCLERRRRDDSFRAVFMFTQVDLRSTIVDEILPHVESYGLPVMASRMALRVDYVRSLLGGRTVLDTPRHGAAAAEINALTDELITIGEHR